MTSYSFGNLFGASPTQAWQEPSQSGPYHLTRCPQHSTLWFVGCFCPDFLPSRLDMLGTYNNSNLNSEQVVLPSQKRSKKGDMNWLISQIKRFVCVCAHVLGTWFASLYIFTSMASMFCESRLTCSAFGFHGLTTSIERSWEVDGNHPSWGANSKIWQALKRQTRTRDRDRPGHLSDLSAGRHMSSNDAHEHAHLTWTMEKLKCPWDFLSSRPTTSKSLLRHQLRCVAPEETRTTPIVTYRL